jgi:hypothetical protein
MVERGFGHVLNLASIGAYQPSPLYASYSAAKSFVLSFTEALSYEPRGTGVHATALSPGVVATEFLQVAGQAPTRYQRRSRMDSPSVARIGVDAMLKGRPSLVAGWRNAAAARETVRIYYPEPDVAAEPYRAVETLMNKGLRLLGEHWQQGLIGSVSDLVGIQ